LPITQELGLSRAATSLVFSLARAEGAIEGPLAGYLIDRLRPRPMMLAGVILSLRAAGCAMLAILALMSLPSHLLVGWIADHVSKPRLMGACMAIGTASLFFLALRRERMVFTILFTFMEAIFRVGWATVGDFFGRKSFATIRGTMSFFYLWGPA